MIIFCSSTNIPIAVSAETLLGAAAAAFFQPQQSVPPLPRVVLDEVPQLVFLRKAQISHAVVTTCVRAYE